VSGNAELWGVETAAQQLAQEMARSLPVTIASVALWDQPSFSLTVKGVSAPRPLPIPVPVGVRVPLSSAHWHRIVFERNEPVFLESDAETQVGFQEEARLSLALNLQSMYLLPIRVGGETIGVLGLGEMRSREREPFSEEKRTRCRAALDEFLVASAPAWEAGRLRRQIRAMSSLFRMVKEILRTRSFQDVLACCASEAADWLGTPVRGILVRARPQNGMEIVGRWLFPDSLTGDDGAQLLLALARAGGDAQWPVSVVNVANDPLDPLHAATQEGQTWTRVSLPLMKDDQLLGVVCLYVEDELHPSEWELEAFRRRGEIAAVGMAIVASRLDQRMEQEWLERAAGELLTAHPRTILQQALTGIAQLVSSRLPKRLEAMVGDLGGAVSEDGPTWRQLADFVARELTAVLAELGEATGRSEDDVPTPLEINQLVRRAVDIARTKWEQRRRHQGVAVDLRFEPSGEPLVVETSLALVGAVLHAIENAMEAIPEGGRVHVRTHRDDGHVVISVADTGPGVAEEFHQKAFAPFSSTKGRHHLGLGLSVVRAFATRHGGEATLSSGDAGGTTLVLRLPRARDGMKGLGDGRETRDETSGKPMNG